MFGLFQQKKLELEAEEEKFVKEYFTTENAVTEEREKQIETDFQKAKFILNCFNEDVQLLELFTVLKDFEVIKLI